MDVSTPTGQGFTVSALEPSCRRLTIFGATGSIGKSTLDVVGSHAEKFDIFALTAQNNVTELAQLSRHHNASHAVIGDESKYGELKQLLAGTGIGVHSGDAAVLSIATEPVDCVMAAIVGAAGLAPTFMAARHARRVALANKECLVSAGEAFMAHVAHHRCELLPVDSEHSGVFQAIAAHDDRAIEQITLTASGGPFRAWSSERMANATVDEALNHPNWSMGAKITIDSATMMNKGLELIEAYHLFPVEASGLDCIIHPQSIVHCLVTFADGSTIAQLAMPDMRTPISYALGWPYRLPITTERLNAKTLSGLTFEQADEQRFPALRLSREALQTGQSAPAVLNAANEIAVQAFLDRKIKFGDITDLVAWVLEQSQSAGLLRAMSSLEDVCDIDQQTRLLSVTRLQS